MEKLQEFDMITQNTRIAELEAQVKELWQLLGEAQQDTARLKKRLAALEGSV